MKKSTVKGVTKTIVKGAKKPEVKAVKKLLPFQKKYLKSGCNCYYKFVIYSTLLIYSVCDSSLKVEKA